MTENADTKYLTATQLAKRWGMSTNTLRNWRFRGVGPRYFKPSGSGGRTLYRTSDIEEWEDRHTTEGS